MSAFTIWLLLCQIWLLPPKPKVPDAHHAAGTGGEE